MFEYQALFDARGTQYSRANRRYPEARAEEATALLRHLDLSPGSRWIDVSAGGGYLSERAVAHGLPPAAFSCDGSLPFLRSRQQARPVSVAAAEALPISDGHFDAAACLAALHHSENPWSACSELLRVTAPGGRAALGDAAEGSPTARFLNGFVDRHTPKGHQGRFYPLDSLAAFFEAAGGRRPRSERVELSWRLPSREAAASFCRDLFGFEPSVTDAQVHDALADLGAGPAEDRFVIPWTMHYVSAERE